MLSSVRKLIPFFGRKSKADRASSSSVSQTPAVNCDSQTSDCWQTVEELESDSVNRKDKNSQAIGPLSRRSHRYLGGLQLVQRRRNEYLVDEDISKGREFNKIPAFSYKRNDCLTADFHYVTDHVQYEPIDVDMSLKIMNCCDCQGNCIDGQCTCSSNLQSGVSYDANGCLSTSYNLESPEVIFECNAACRCNRRLCNNSVIQRGARCRLTLFRTKSRGWGVRAAENLQRGTFIGVYSGELISANASQEREDDTYLFNLATTTIYYQQRWGTTNELEYTETRQQRQDNGKTMEQFVCDAKHFGNVTRFINHSCEPNVVGIRTFTTHQDPRFPYIAFFANKDIAAKSELLLNYGDNYWMVKCKRDKIYCLCKTDNCRFSKRRFPETLREYNNQRRKTQQDTTN